MTTTTTQYVAEYSDIDEARFHGEIIAGGRPAILRGFVRHWPAVKLALEAPGAVCQYLADCDNGHPVDALLMAAEHKGRLFYRDDMTGFNFSRRKLPISSVIEQLVRYSHFEAAPSVAVQSALIDDCVPRFGRENVLPFFDGTVRPRIWVGNAIITPAHFDESDNLACVIAGRRRFTLFAPEQVANLYIGPLDFAPTPTPISMVDFNAPDFARFPRFRDAQAAALVADLGPGDALYIPTLWWHHVQSHGELNILVNYWWKGAGAGAAMAAMVACMQALHMLAPAQRRSWAALFGHYVFDPDTDPGAHIAPGSRGVLAKARP